MKLAGAEKIVEIELADIADKLARKYGCRVDVSCEVNNVGRKMWSVGLESTGTIYEWPDLDGAIERAAFKQESSKQKAKRLRKNAARMIAEARKLENGR